MRLHSFNTLIAVKPAQKHKRYDKSCLQCIEDAFLQRGALCDGGCNTVKLFRTILIFTFVALATSAQAGTNPATTGFDKNLTYVGFNIRYLLILHISGHFNDFKGDFIIDRDHPENSHADIIVKTTSVDTGVESRNRDIRGPALFDADKYPEMIFHSDKIKLGPDNTGLITGNLTLRGVTKPITLALLEIPDVAARQNKRDDAYTGGFIVTGEIKRSDFGMNSFIRPIGDVVTLFVCYKMKKCDNLHTQAQKTQYRYNR